MESTSDSVGIYPPLGRSRLYNLHLLPAVYLGTATGSHALILGFTLFGRQLCSSFAFAFMKMHSLRMALTCCRS